MIGASSNRSEKSGPCSLSKVVRTTFDNEQGPDFSDLFEEAPIIEGTPTDSARLRAYAMHLRDLMAAKDTLNIYRAHKPRFDDIQFSASKALDVIGRNWLAPDWRLEFQASDVALRKWSDGRIWEIYREDEVSRALRKQALFLAGEERLQTWHTVYVAEVNDSLRVVR